jgi:hypothetical protein
LPVLALAGIGSADSAKCQRAKQRGVAQ